MPSSAPGATKEPRSRDESRRSFGLALGVLGGIIGGLMALVFFAMAALGAAIDADATRAEETAVMVATVGLLVLAILGAAGGITCRTDPRRGAALQAGAAVGGVVLFLLMGLVEITGLGGDSSEGYLVDAIWLVVGFWSVPALLFSFGAALARGGVDSGSVAR